MPRSGEVEQLRLGDAIAATELKPLNGVAAPMELGRCAMRVVYVRLFTLPGCDYC